MSYWGFRECTQRQAICVYAALVAPHRTLSAKVVLTGSGGMQEETSYLGIPCLTLRSNTERPITITHGTNTLVGDDLGRAYQEFSNILTGARRQSFPITGWDGHAPERFATIIYTNWNGCSVV